ncbi:MAG: methyltransferase domain-containing protein [Anaerolineales bacterium]|nr:methyltransferase domain-containing protein [Anaerolineales bacterium]
MGVIRVWRRFLQLFFRLLYNECAWAYDLVAWMVSFGQWNRWGQAAIPHLCGSRVLELGHGPGHLLAAMGQRGLNPVGLDASRAMGRLARRKRMPTGAPTPLVRARAQALPFRDGAFESAVATFPTEYIVDPATLREVARVLKGRAGGPGGGCGRLVVVGWVRLTQRDLGSRVLAWLYRVTGQGEPPAGWVGPQQALEWFEVSTVRQSVGRAEVALIVAEKRAAPRR